MIQTEDIWSEIPSCPHFEIVLCTKSNTLNDIEYQRALCQDRHEIALVEINISGMDCVSLILYSYLHNSTLISTTQDK